MDGTVTVTFQKQKKTVANILEVFKLFLLKAHIEWGIWEKGAPVFRIF